MNLSTALTTVQAITPTAGSNGGNGSFVLSRVLKNTLNPTGTLDLIGDGSGILGLLCQATTTGGASGNTCNCTYTYSSPSAPNQIVDTPVIYNETDLLRCNYGAMASDVTSMKVSIHLTTSDTYSNQLTFNYNGTGVTLNTSLLASFVQPRRYQCNDILVGVNYLFDPSIYDPIQSDNFHLTYPLDFYYTNPGGNLSTYALNNALNPNSSANRWLCPPILNPEATFASATDLLDYNSNNHVNLSLYSKAPLATGATASQYVIYPPPAHPLVSGNIDRSTFYLAKQASGVFGVAVDAYVSPGVNTSPNSTGASSLPPPPLGYGASPISTGSGQETCPGSFIPIPTGFHWVKLWLFRASLDQRSIAVPGPRGTGPGKSSSLLELGGGILCNPGDWPPDTTKTGLTIFPVISSCPRDIADWGAAGDAVTLPALPAVALSTVSATTTNTLLADRYLSTGECVRLDAINSTTGVKTTGAGGTLLTNCISGPGLGCGAEKQDFWSTWYLDAPSLGASAPLGDAVFQANSTASPATGYTSAIGQGCNASTVYDPLNICSTAVLPQTKNVGAGAAAPFSTNITSQPLDQGSARFDFIFVVTPPSIMVNDMLQQNAAAAPYQPYRFQTDQDCLDVTGVASSNPIADNALSSTNCNNNTSINTYGLKLHDVGSNGDAPANDPNRAGVFPVCALQPN